ncbi:MAG: Haloacid dehalogenase domain protein hydrolase [Bacteroidetes bacterium]|nr:Haloacid dehalogenase domain protein hydrolase [Bacteroidota bacterium]
MLSLSSYDFIIFDLDGTLYDEALYLYAAYRSIAQKLAATYGLNTGDIESTLIRGFESEGRNGLFNKLCQAYDIPQSAIAGMLQQMRAFEISDIALYDKMKDLIRELVTAGKKLFIITNGNPAQQANKIKAIDWQGLDDHIEVIFANTIAPKPDRAAFDHLVEKFGLVPSKTVFIGDTESDEEFARNAGIDFVHAHGILSGKD